MKKIIRYVCYGILLVVFVYACGYMVIPKLLTIGKHSNHNVYVSLGFHVNMYHSYRIDTNDEAGFGKDIRVIRKIIEVLDEKNKKGIPVKGVWDFENLFTLEEILPQYAPDIIANIKRRVKEHGDEIILMSYNNGLVSAMTQDECMYSVKYAISNSRRSGVKDIFKDYSPFVRPQEMMATSGNYELYKQLGLQGIVLYYSGIPFDAFRVFVDELSLEEAHNPLMYHNKNTHEKMMVIPAYNQADLIENVSIYNWVHMLRYQQLRGTINNDVMICINADADDSYWYGYDLPSYLKWLPNTGGLSQLIDDIASLDFVTFTTIGDYVKNHKPVKEISFGQDTADGSFNGYVSWAEKKYCSDYWTAVEKDRNIHKLAEAYYSFIGQSAPGDITTALKRSFEKRMRLLSTTNFGMATPFLAKNREHVVETITHSMESLTKPVVADIKKGAKGIIAKQAINTNDGYEYVTSLLLLQQDTAPFVFKLPMELPQGYTYYMQSKDMLTPVNMFSSNGVSTIFIGRQPLHSGVYHIVRTQPGTKHYAAEATDTMIKNNTITVTVDNGFIQGVEAHGSTILNKMSLIPWIAYNGQDYRPEKITASVLSDGKNGVAAVALRGEIALPENVTRGYFDYTIYLVDDIDMLFVEGTITYPDTPRTTIFKPGMPALARIYDERWQQVIPCPLFAAMTATKDIPFTVIKKNYFGVEDTYKIDYFKHSKENLRLANVNNHITAGYVAVTNSKEFIAVAKDNEVLSNFAFCPLKIDYGMVKGFTVSLNPFGTFFGRQYFQPTWGNGQGFKSAILNGDQYHSGACTYSGTTQRFSLAIAHGRGALQQSVKAQLQSFAHQPFIVAMNEVTPVQQKQKLQSPKGVVALYNNGGVYINFEKVDGAAGYNIYCGNKDALKKIGVTSNTSFFAKNNWDGKPFVEGNTYVAAVSAYDDNGNVNKVPVTYTFVAKPVKESLDLPLTLQLKILYHCLVAQLRW